MHYHFSEVRHSSKTESVSQWTTRQELRAEGGSQWKSELSSSRTFHPSLWHRLGACRRCPWGTRRSWRCRGGTGWWGRWGDSSCASAILKQDQLTVKIPVVVAPAPTVGINCSIQFSIELIYFAGFIPLDWIGQLNQVTKEKGSHLPSWTRRTTCASGCRGSPPSGSQVAPHCCLWNGWEITFWGARCRWGVYVIGEWGASWGR